MNHDLDKAEAVSAESSQARCPVVAVGAWGGGADALGRFFAAMPADSGAAYVVHLQLDQMAQVMAGLTTMPVVQVEGAAQIRPNRVYVTVPGHALTVEHGMVHRWPTETGGYRNPVDVLFRSVAVDMGDRAIAILLADPGSPGTEGLKEVRAAGGLTLMQEPATDEGGTPQRADMADHVLAAGAMPEILCRYFRIAGIAEADAQPLIDSILAVVQSRTGHNFASYRASTLRRRIQRRLGLRNIVALGGYLEVLQCDPDEADWLARDLLINVTGFFRDAEAWVALRDLVIAPMVDAKPDGAAIRAWVPGCSTGEEAYSLAMLIAEQSALAGKTFDVKIFATDAREDNLTAARDGRYLAGAVMALDAARLEQYFDACGPSYRIKKELRGMIVFAPQNLLRDPPFSRLDLITCRNLLIYLKPEVQAQVISLFHFALEPNGVLMLGNTETAGQGGVFDALSLKWRIFRRSDAKGANVLNFPVLRGQRSPAVAARQPYQPTMPTAAQISAADLARRALLDRFAPAAVLIDAASQVVYFHGSTSAFLEQPTGEPSSDLYAMAREGLAVPLRDAVRQARAKPGDVSFDVALPQASGESPVAVHVSPIGCAAGQGHVLISFGCGTLRVGGPAPVHPSQENMLRDELAGLRFELQNMISHLETANEELKASNEEASLINEELQSTNEELLTLNGHLQVNVRALEDSTNDLNNLLAGTDTATVFIDRQLCLKWFTPGTRALFDFIPTDIGRPLQHFAKKFVDDALLADAARVLQQVQVNETEVRSAAGRWYMRRMLPYRTQNNRVAGVVIIFLDVTESNLARAANTEARGFAQAIVEAVRQPLLVVDEGLRVVSVNPAFERMFAVTEAAVIGRDWNDLAQGEWNAPRLLAMLHSVVRDAVAFDVVEVALPLPEIGLRHLVLSGRRLIREGAGPGLALVTILDLTDERRGEAAGRRLAAIVDSSQDAIIGLDVDGQITHWNSGAESLFGYNTTEVVGQSMGILVDPSSPVAVPDCLAHFKDGGGTLRYEVPRRRKDGSSVWVSVAESPLRDAGGGFLAASSIAQDITERRAAEQRRDMLVNELNHRVKNSLAVAQAIAAQTLRGDLTLAEARTAFGVRLAAFGRAHDLSMGRDWQGNDLGSVVRATVAPHAGDPGRFTINGPFLPLIPQAAVTFSLALHELCINATKFGALSVPEGAVDIGWTVSGPPDNEHLEWIWTERGGPPVNPPDHRGFGFSLIERVLPMELNGKVRIEYPGTGLVCALEAPIPPHR